MGIGALPIPILQLPFHHRTRRDVYNSLRRRGHCAAIPLLLRPAINKQNFRNAAFRAPALRYQVNTTHPFPYLP